LLRFGQGLRLVNVVRCAAGRPFDLHQHRQPRCHVAFAIQAGGFASPPFDGFALQTLLFPDMHELYGGAAWPSVTNLTISEIFGAIGRDR
jgi:hypothetical protein